MHAFRDREDKLKWPEAGLQEIGPSHQNNGLREIRPQCHTKSREEGNDRHAWNAANMGH